MRYLASRMTSKGQVTIPAEVREHLGLKPKDSVQFEVKGDEVVMKPVRSEILKWFGSVKPRRRPEDWKKLREEVELAIAEDADIYHEHNR